MNCALQRFVALKLAAVPNHRRIREQTADLIAESPVRSHIMEPQ